MIVGNKPAVRAALLLTRIAMAFSCRSQPQELKEFIAKETEKVSPRYKRKVKEVAEALKCIALKKPMPKWVKKSNKEIALAFTRWVDASR